MPEDISGIGAGLSDKLRRGEIFNADCPSRAVLAHVSSRWGVLALIALLDGTHRFSALRRKCGGVSEKMLAQTLRALEGDGLLVRTSYPVVPPRVEYHLSELGREVAPLLRELVDWIEINMARLGKPV